MKAASAGMISLLAANKYLVKADLYTFTLQAGANAGTVLYYTSAQQNVVYNGHTFLAASLDSAPGFKRDKVKTALGVTAQALDIDILYDANTRILGLTPGAFAHAGGFDNALVEIDKVLADTWPNLYTAAYGVINLFTGIVADQVEIEDGLVKVSVSSMLRLLSGAFPRNYYLPGCNHALFDSGCTLNPASFVVAGTVSNTGGAPTNSVFNSSLTQADGYFALGYLVWTSGANNGLTCQVQGYLNANGNIQILYPLGVVPSAGDTFNIYPGCDKQQSTCTNKFSNAAHFGGFPFVPTPETISGGAGNGTQPKDNAGDRGTRGGSGGRKDNFRLQ